MIELAVQSPGYCAELLGQLAEQKDVTTLLAVFRELASPRCLWLEGELAVELFEDDAGVRVRVLEEVGGGLRERVLPTITLPIALSDVLSEIYEAPELIGDLRIERVSSRCAMLRVGVDEDAAASVFEISETCLSVPAAATTNEDLDRGWDEAL